jgi:serine/threonine protein kinase
MIGTVISHYKILEKLGEGGMSSLIRNLNKLILKTGGVVYEAKSTKLKGTVAFKFLPPELNSETEFLKR